MAKRPQSVVLVVPKAWSYDVFIVVPKLDFTTIVTRSRAFSNKLQEISTTACPSTVHCKILLFEAKTRCLNATPSVIRHCSSQSTNHHRSASINFGHGLTVTVRFDSPIATAQKPHAESLCPLKRSTARTRTTPGSKCPHVVVACCCLKM